MTATGLETEEARGMVTDGRMSELVVLLKVNEGAVGPADDIDAEIWPCDCAPEIIHQSSVRQ